MKKISFILGLVLSISLIQGSVFADTAPRIAVWQGKVNQHIDTSTGQWVSDADGSSGAELDKLTYCKKWYPNTTSVSSGQTETITTWKRASYYEQSDYTNTVPTYNCVQGAANIVPSIRVLSPNGGEVYQAGQRMNVQLRAIGYSSSALMSMDLYTKSPSGVLTDTYLTGAGGPVAGDSTSSIPIPANTPTGSNYVIHVDTYDPITGVRQTDSSDNVFTIQSSTPNTSCGINSFTANPMTVSAGGIVDFAWNTNCTNTGIKELDGFPNKNFGTTGTTNAVVDNTTTFTLYASNDSGCNGTVYSMTTGAQCSYATASVTVGVRPSTSGDTTPRIMFWPGKVNQHTDTNGTWQTDPDGRSGGNNYMQYSNDYGGREVEYCRKWYPNTTSITSYKSETIPTWRAAGNTGSYTGTFISYKCVQGTAVTTPSITVLSPNGGEQFSINNSLSYSYKLTYRPFGTTTISIVQFPSLANPGTTYSLGGGTGENNQSDYIMGGNIGTIGNYSNIVPGTYYFKVAYISRDGTQNLVDFSDASFSIIAGTSPTAPVLKVVSPNGGETYTEGQQITVKWNTQNIPASAILTLNLLSQTNPTAMYSLSNDAGNYTFSNDGQETVILPPPAFGWHNGLNYKVRVFVTGTAPSMADDSDGSFSIQTATTPSVTLPAGCTSTAGYSTTSGQPCSLPDGCSANSGFSSITGQPCVSTGGRPAQSTTTTTPTIGIATSSFTRELKIGVSGTDVSALQTRLKTEGVYSGKISGYFGTLTQAAVKKFQTKYGIPAVGAVGPRTLQVLNKASIKEAMKTWTE